MPKWATADQTAPSPAYIATQPQNRPQGVSSSMATASTLAPVVENFMRSNGSLSSDHPILSPDNGSPSTSQLPSPTATKETSPRRPPTITTQPLPMYPIVIQQRNDNTSRPHSQPEATITELNTPEGARTRSLPSSTSGSPPLATTPTISSTGIPLRNAGPSSSSVTPAVTVAPTTIPVSKTPITANAPLGITPDGILIPSPTKETSPTSLHPAMLELLVSKATHQTGDAAPLLLTADFFNQAKKLSSTLGASTSEGQGGLGVDLSLLPVAGPSVGVSAGTEDVVMGNSAGESSSMQSVLQANGGQSSTSGFGVRAQSAGQSADTAIIVDVGSPLADINDVTSHLPPPNTTISYSSNMVNQSLPPRPLPLGQIQPLRGSTALISPNDVNGYHLRVSRLLKAAEIAPRETPRSEIFEIFLTCLDIHEYDQVARAEPSQVLAMLDRHLDLLRPKLEKWMQTSAPGKAQIDVHVFVAMEIVDKAAKANRHDLIAKISTIVKETVARLMVSQPPTQVIPQPIQAPQPQPQPQPPAVSGSSRSVIEQGQRMQYPQFVDHHTINNVVNQAHIMQMRQFMQPQPTQYLPPGSYSGATWPAPAPAPQAPAPVSAGPPLTHIRQNSMPTTNYPLPQVLPAPQLQQASGSAPVSAPPANFDQIVQSWNQSISEVSSHMQNSWDITVRAGAALTDAAKAMTTSLKDVIQQQKVEMNSLQANIQGLNDTVKAVEAQSRKHEREKHTYSIRIIQLNQEIKNAEQAHATLEQSRNALRDTMASSIAQAESKYREQYKKEYETKMAQQSPDPEIAKLKEQLLKRNQRMTQIEKEKTESIASIQEKTKIQVDELEKKLYTAKKEIEKKTEALNTAQKKDQQIQDLEDKRDELISKVEILNQSLEKYTSKEKEASDSTPAADPEELTKTKTNLEHAMNALSMIFSLAAQLRVAADLPLLSPSNPADKGKNAARTLQEVRELVIRLRKEKETAQKELEELQTTSTETSQNSTKVLAEKDKQIADQAETIRQKVVELERLRDSNAGLESAKSSLMASADEEAQKRAAVITEHHDLVKKLGEELKAEKSKAVTLAEQLEELQADRAMSVHSANSASEDLKEQLVAKTRQFEDLSNAWAELEKEKDDEVKNLRVELAALKKAKQEEGEEPAKVSREKVVEGVVKPFSKAEKDKVPAVEESKPVPPTENSKKRKAPPTASSQATPSNSQKAAVTIDLTLSADEEPPSSARPSRKAKSKALPLFDPAPSDDEEDESPRAPLRKRSRVVTSPEAPSSISSQNRIQSSLWKSATPRNSTTPLPQSTPTPASGSAIAALKTVPKKDDITRKTQSTPAPPVTSSSSQATSAAKKEEGPTEKAGSATGTSRAGSTAPVLDESLPCYTRDWMKKRITVVSADSKDGKTWICKACWHDMGVGPERPKSWKDFPPREPGTIEDKVDHMFGAHKALIQTLYLKRVKEGKEKD